MLSLAQTEHSIAITGNRLDTNPWLFNVLNGTINLRTGDFYHHRREDMISKIAPVNCDLTCIPPELWFSFLDRTMAGSSGLIKYLQKFTGYSLTGDTREKCLPVAYGIGDNGKTIFTATIGGMLGDYAQETPIDTLMIKRNESIPNDIARLKGARLVTASEGERGQKLAESLIKRLTGGDKVSARFLHQEWFEFTPEFKIFLSTNHRPIIRGGDNAIWNRIHLVPFEVIIPKSEQIPRTVMLERLRQEWSGILKWAVEGCLLWQEEGLEKPEEVERATDDYRADSDIIGGFISDCCIVNPLAKCTKAELRSAYEIWCSKNDEEPVSTRNFKSILMERGIKDCRVGAKAEKGWKGIGFKNTVLTVPDRPTFRVFSPEENFQKNNLKNRSVSVLSVLSATCGLCANFEPNQTNPGFQGRCISTPPDENRSRFPNLEIDCPEFREKEMENETSVL
jgi:putative DNA primase/helicase